MAEALTEEAVEQIAEATPEFVEALTGIRASFVVLASAFSALAGAATGFEVARRRLQAKYEKIAEEEIDEMRDHFRARLVAKEEKPDLSELGKKAKELGYSSDGDVPAPQGEVNTPAVPPEVRNVFEDRKSDHEWDYETEKASRNPDKPYVIHYDERGETELEMITLTYYAGDDVLCNEKDTIIEDQDKLVGVENLDRFGHGSQDVNIVYVRNEDLSLEIEVIKSDKTYAEEVHGFSHGDAPRKRKREWDE